MLQYLARPARPGYHAPVPRFRAVVTDLDNTLYPWVDYIVPSLEAMVESLVATTGLPRIRIVQSLKEVYSRYESNEYPFAIQESDIFQPYERDFDSFNRLVVEPAASAFKAARARFLHPYPGVRETLDWIRGQGLKVVGLTDAPRNAAELRLKTMKLDGHFDALYTLPGYQLPKHVDPAIRRREEAGHYRSRTEVRELPREAEKPSPAGLRRILEDFGLRGAEVIYVGDNVKKDMPVARACGALGVWAEYGTRRGSSGGRSPSPPSSRCGTCCRARAGRRRGRRPVARARQGARGRACHDASGEVPGPGGTTGAGGRRVLGDRAGHRRGPPRAGDEGGHSL
ncbi:MAG: Haloacid dehalogenase-like hydrolase [Anaeromyxobacteraceae bacterium]|nr:Haloacid dehalogenase-like hydrolase [Anaeromyxobacteraceae bacterium]